MVQGMGYDYTIDIWALGILLFEMVAGVAPFRGESPEEVLTEMKRSIIFSEKFGKTGLTQRRRRSTSSKTYSGSILVKGHRLPRFLNILTFNQKNFVLRRRLWTAPMRNNRKRVCTQLMLARMIIRPKDILPSLGLIMIHFLNKGKFPNHTPPQHTKHSSRISLYRQRALGIRDCIIP